MRSNRVLQLALLVLCLAAIGAAAAEAQRICQPAMYTPPTPGLGMTGTVIITFNQAGCVPTNTNPAFNPYGTNYTECTLLGGMLTTNTMFTLRAMVTAGAAFPRKCSWYLQVTGPGCSGGLVCKMSAADASGGPASLPVELMEFSVEGGDEAADEAADAR